MIDLEERVDTFEKRAVKIYNYSKTAKDKDKIFKASLMHFQLMNILAILKTNRLVLRLTNK